MGKLKLKTQPLKKLLGVNLTKHVQRLYAENYTIMIKEGIPWRSSG